MLLGGREQRLRRERRDPGESIEDTDYGVLNINIWRFLEYYRASTTEASAFRFECLQIRVLQGRVALPLVLRVKTDSTTD